MVSFEKKSSLARIIRLSFCVKRLPFVISLRIEIIGGIAYAGFF